MHSVEFLNVMLSVITINVVMPNGMAPVAILYQCLSY
jgi:hypothetical protein